MVLGQLGAEVDPFFDVWFSRRQLAAQARNAGAYALAIQILLEGELVPEAVELADREVDRLQRSGRLNEAARRSRNLAQSSASLRMKPLRARTTGDGSEE